MAVDTADRARIVKGYRIDRQKPADGPPDAPYYTLASPGTAQLRMAEGDSLMVGFWLPDAIAKKIALPGGEAPANLHLTLAYLGDVNELVADAQERLSVAVQMFALAVGSVSFKLNGVARFGGEIDKPDVIYATVEDEDGSLSEFRWRLCMALEMVGLTPRNDHGYWVPHVTLAYVDPGAVVNVRNLPYVEIELDSVSISDRRDSTADTRVMHTLRPPAYQYGPSIMMAEPIKAMEPPPTIPVLPVPGSYKHPVYGTIDLTEERIANFVANFVAGVYQDKLPIDLEHESKVSGAAGWITELITNSDGSVNAVVEWTDRGIDMLAADRFQYISPEWFDVWTDPVTETDYADILIGAALCTRPFFKSLVLSERTLPRAASEAVPTTETEGHTMPGEDPKAAAQPAIQPTGMTEDQARRFAEMESTIANLNGENAALKTANEAAVTQGKALGEQVAKLAAERRRDRFTLLVTGKGGEGDGVRWFGEPAKHVSTMEFIADHAPEGEESTQFKDYVSQQMALGEQMKTHNVLSEIGTANGQPAPSGAWDKVLAAAKKARETDPKLTQPEAVNHVLMNDPGLAREYHQEQRSKR